MTNVVIHYSTSSVTSARVISKTESLLHQKERHKKWVRFSGNEISMWAVDIF